jgi:phosphopantetheinyl transferase (holo-ACP synthase)
MRPPASEAGGVRCFLRTVGRWSVVGNDILDVHFVDAPAYHHVRYLERVCTQAESQAVRDSADPSRSLAVVWASKEAAYKLFVKRHPGPCFVPRRFVTWTENGASLDSVSEVRVAYVENRATVAISSAGQWVHAIATSSEGLVVRWSVQKIERLFPGRARARSESDAVRFLARELLLKCGLEDAELEFVGRVPTIRRRDRGCSEIGISLSHHGGFASAVIAWPADESSPPRMNRSLWEVSSWEAVCSTCMV